MTDRLTIALAQANPTVGDIAANAARVRDLRARARAAGADAVVFSELFLIGYPPEDLVLRPALQRAAGEELTALAGETADGGPAVILPTCWCQDGEVYNAVAVLDGGEVAAVSRKHDLPNYGVFDEKRVFAAGPLPGPVSLRGVRLGLAICEDIWAPDVTECLAETGAEILVVPNGSPYEDAKQDERMMYAVARVTETGLPLIYLNQVGGQDELVFDGASFVLNADRRLAVQAPAFVEDLTITTWSREADGWVCAPGPFAPPPGRLESIYRAMVLGLRDYVTKNGFPGVVLGLSGGVDSALSAAVAVDALGADKVRCVMLPSRFTSQESLDDAVEAARLMGTDLDSLSIAGAVEALHAELAPVLGAAPEGVTAENLQPRLRAVLLMALSNRLGHMVLTTGNKSEMSVGYATIYGDMCGGYSVLKDVYKTTVYELCDWRNRHRPDGLLGPEGRVMPQNILTKAPTAELKPGQTDQDTLPPYAELDDVLTCLVEQEMPLDEIVARGHAPETIARIENLLFVAEYKRRQAPPGVKITRRNFGRDRRYPITNRFRERP